LKKRLNRGFSFLELMVTIGVITIIGAVGLPAIDNFGVAENYQNDLATIRGQFNYIRQLSLEDGSAYRVKVVNNDNDNTANLEVWRATGLNRYNVEFHKGSSPPCSAFGSTGNNGEKQNDLSKSLEFLTIKKCTGIDNNCTKVSASQNYFCFLPDGSSPENSRAEMKAGTRAGGRTEFLHFYLTGFFNNGDRM